MGALPPQPGRCGALFERPGGKEIHRHPGHRHILGGLDRPNAYGETVFVNGDPTRPNEAYFKHVDWVVDKAESLGLYIGMVPIWSKEYVQQDRALLDQPSYGPSIRSAIRASGPSVVDQASAYSYGKFLGSRYRDKPIIWILGGDWFATGVEDIWRAMAAGIAAGDGGTQLKTYHPKSPAVHPSGFTTTPGWISTCCKPAIRV